MQLDQRHLKRPNNIAVDILDPTPNLPPAKPSNRLSASRQSATRQSASRQSASRQSAGRMSARSGSRRPSSRLSSGKRSGSRKSRSRRSASRTSSRHAAGEEPESPTKLMKYMNDEEKKVFMRRRQAHERRKTIETMMLREPQDLDAKQIVKISEMLITEFKFFKELSEFTNEQTQKHQQLDMAADPRLQKPKSTKRQTDTDGGISVIGTGIVANLVAKHLRMVRTFEQKNLTEQGKFVNTDGVYMVFDGFCGVYKKKKKIEMRSQKSNYALVKELMMNQGTENGNEETTNAAKELLSLIMLQDAKVGSLVGVESHLYDNCNNIFTIKSDEKTKLIMIDAEGFKKYVKDFVNQKHQRIINMYQSMPFLRNTTSTFQGLMQLVLLTDIRQIYADTLIVRQGERCKYLYFINRGKFTVLRELEFIDQLTAPLEDQITYKDEIDKEMQIINAKMNYLYQEPTQYLCTKKVRQLQITQLKKGKLFGDHNFETDKKTIERKPGEIGYLKEVEPYSVLTFIPGELFFIERQIFAACVDDKDVQNFVKFKTDYPTDVELRKKFIGQQAWDDFKRKNLSPGRITPTLTGQQKQTMPNMPVGGPDQNQRKLSPVYDAKKTRETIQTLMAKKYNSIKP